MSENMKILKKIKELNKEFVTHVEDKTYSSVYEERVSKYPEQKLAILACMDTRMVDFLEPAMGIRRGEAKVIKTAGNTITGYFDGVIRSLLICIYELGVEEIIVAGHYDCGMTHSTSDELMKKMRERGVAEDALYIVKPELIAWADFFQHPVQNVLHTVEQLRHNPFIPKEIPIHGVIVDPETGILDVVSEGYKWAGIDTEGNSQ